MRLLLISGLWMIFVTSFALAVRETPVGTQNSPTLAVAGALAATIPDPTPCDDPFPILRYRATEAQVPTILKQSETNPLVQLRRSDFESRVRAAGRLVAEAKTPPRITQSRYSATLIGGDLVGTAELDLVKLGATPQFLSLDPFRLALTSSTWLDGREAIVGSAAGGSSPSVWVDRPGAQTLKLAWSLAGAMEFGERRFEMRVPPSLSTMLDLELPVAFRPTVTSDILLTGPFRRDGDTLHASWRLHSSGRPRLDFAIRTAGSLGASATSNLTTHYEITAGQMTCTYEYDLRPAKGTVSEWAFLVDSGLQVTDVVVNNRTAWVVDPPTTPGGPRRLRLDLNQPGRGGKVLISCVAVLPDPTRPADSPLPMIRPVNTLVEDETLEIRLGPDLKPEKWLPGDYHLIDSQLLPDQTRVFSLMGTLTSAGTDRAFRLAPSLTYSLVEPQFTSTEKIAWRFTNDRITAQFQLGIRVIGSPLFRLTVRTPPGYTLARVSSPQDDLIASTVSANSAVTVEFTHPLLVGQLADFVFEFLGPRTTANRYAFPAFTPTRTSERLGVLGIITGPLWSIAVQPGVGTRSTPWLDVESPRAPLEATLSFRYRGHDPSGSLLLTPIQPEFSTAIESHLEQQALQTVSKSTLTIKLHTGGVSSLLIVEPEGEFTKRTWRVSGVNAVVSATPLPVAELVRELGLLTPSLPGRLSVLVGRKAPQLGTLWVIRLAHTVTDELVLETTASRPGSSEQTVLPRLSLLGSRNSPVAAEAARASTDYLSHKRDWNFSGLYLVTAVRSEEEAEVVFGGTATTVAENKLVLQLPAHAEVRAVSIDGHGIEPGNQQLSSAGSLEVPMPSLESHRFEVRYRLPLAPSFPTRVSSPEPHLPVSGTALQRFWLFGSGILPGWPMQSWDRAKAVDLPHFLTGNPFGSINSVVYSTDRDEIRVGSSQQGTLIGILTTTVLVLFAWFGRRPSRTLCGLTLIVALLVMGAINLSGPPWWQRAMTLPISVGLFGAAGMVLARGYRSMAILSAGLVIMCTLAPRHSLAQLSPPALVVILPREAEGPENVVVAKSVLDRLATISHATASAVIITNAEYSLAVDETTARVTARIITHALGDAETTLTLPLSDARLERVSVDGNEAFPISPKPGIYTVPLPSKGRHELQLRFSVPVSGSGTEREIRFGIPECPASHLMADFPATARQVQLVGRFGKQSQLEASPRRLEIEAGSLKTVQFRWRDGIAATASIKVREACVWDVGVKGLELTACYLTRVDQGSISVLRYDLPAELEPVEVSLRPLDATSGASLRDWTLLGEQGGFRQLRLDLQGQTTGRMLTVLSCRLKKAATWQPVLRFPKPIIGGAAAETDSAFGLRARESTYKIIIEDLKFSGMIDYDPGVLIRDKEWNKVSELRLDATNPVRVFRPSTKANPELRPTLRPAWELPQVSLTTNWHVEPHHAEARGVIQWTEKDPLPLVEFALPGIQILEIHGPELASWSQHSGRVLVWFRKPSSEGEIEWIGTSNPVPNGQPVPPTLLFEAQTPRLGNSRLISESVSIDPAETWTVAVERDRGWNSATRRGEGLTFQTNNATTTPVRVILSPTPQFASINAFGWLSPSPRWQNRLEKTGPASPKAVTPVAPPLPDTTMGQAPPPPWTVPLIATLGWSCALAIVALLLMRFPSISWPEQFGLLSVLFGIAVVGYWWVGLVGWIVARLLGLIAKLLALRVTANASG